ncbi:hypothetical protein EGR_10614 [Echinococcus granulosus]|uniref:Uncharacterized protein n=1 Tax=Echinococcus granulosus TaxID=6210 RepID=W6U0A4_ECHGR|nr:hypothetical protein EGR_10614 [Echinococcus granulosus]EUB54530.1 hypothetical protein EGR_10614 [Echinococcus granulosus]
MSRVQYYSTLSKIAAVLCVTLCTMPEYTCLSTLNLWFTQTSANQLDGKHELPSSTQNELKTFPSAFFLSSENHRKEKL